MIVSPRQGKLVDARHIQNISGGARLQRIGAQSDHFLAGNKLIDVMLVPAKLLPLICPAPERVAAGPEPLVALGQGAPEFRAPAADDDPQIQQASLEIPIMAVDDFDLPIRKMLV